MFWDPVDFTWDQRIRGTIRKGIHVLFNSAKISGSEKNIFIYIEYICQIMLMLLGNILCLHTWWTYGRMDE